LKWRYRFSSELLSDAAEDKDYGRMNCGRKTAGEEVSKPGARDIGSCRTVMNLTTKTEWANETLLRWTAQGAAAKIKPVASSLAKPLKSRLPSPSSAHRA
jgi:hypothetical protein